MTTITNLLTRSWSTPQELYKLFETDNVSRYFLKVKNSASADIFTSALEINDETKSIVILNYDALFALAEIYKNGDLSAAIPRNLHRYEICLAMIAMDVESKVRDLRGNHKALTLLKSFYEKHPKSNLNVAGKTYLDLVNFKLSAIEQYTNATVIPSDQVAPTGKPFQDSHHVAQQVLVQGDKKTENSKVKTIKKHEVEAHVAGIEVLCGTLMELFVGPGQPSTRQEEKQLNGTVPILSEEIEFSRFSDEATYKKWAGNGFKHAAEIDVACVFLADDDASLRNGGLRKDNGLPVRIDFDKAIAPITLRLTGKEKQPKKQRINNTDYLLAGLFETEGFAIHADDFNSLPLLATKIPRPEITLNHYVPSNWWANNFISDPVKFAQIKELQTQANYQEAKFRSILEKIILPESLIKFLADMTIFHAEDKKEVLAWLKARQLQLTVQAESINGFGQYLKSNGARGLDYLKMSYESFAAKRKDLNLPSKIILQEYQRNLGYLQNTFRDSIFIDTRPLAQQSMESERLRNLFEEMNAKKTKFAQKDYFIGQLASLSQFDLDFLSKYMQRVQLGRIVDHPFKTIRTERHPLLFTSGNTNTWVEMRHAVKAEMIAKLKHSYQDDGKIILESSSYDAYHQKLSEHSGRLFKRFGKTASVIAFEKSFSRAVNNETPTASRYDRGK